MLRLIIFWVAHHSPTIYINQWTTAASLSNGSNLHNKACLVWGKASRRWAEWVSCHYPEGLKQNPCKEQTKKHTNLSDVSECVYKYMLYPAIRRRIINRWNPTGFWNKIYTCDTDLPPIKRICLAGGHLHTHFCCWSRSRSLLGCAINIALLTLDHLITASDNSVGNICVWTALRWYYFKLAGFFCISFTTWLIYIVHVWTARAATLYKGCDFLRGSRQLISRQMECDMA